jgi:hypothetical protein
VKVRQAQNWMHQLGYRLKRAGYTYFQARSEEAKRFRKALKKSSSENGMGKCTVTVSDFDDEPTSSEVECFWVGCSFAGVNTEIQQFHGHCKERKNKKPTTYDD